MPQLKAFLVETRKGLAYRSPHCLEFYLWSQFFYCCMPVFRNEIKTTFFLPTLYGSIYFCIPSGLELPSCTASLLTPRTQLWFSFHWRFIWWPPISICGGSGPFGVPFICRLRHPCFYDSLSLTFESTCSGKSTYCILFLFAKDVPFFMSCLLDSTSLFQPWFYWWRMYRLPSTDLSVRTTWLRTPNSIVYV